MLREGELQHIEAALREIGTLLIAFGPLEAAFNPVPSGSAVVFVVFGGVIFGLGIMMERLRRE